MLVVMIAVLASSPKLMKPLLTRLVQNNKRKHPANGIKLRFQVILLKRIRTMGRRSIKVLIRLSQMFPVLNKAFFMGEVRLNNTPVINAPFNSKSTGNRAFRVNHGEMLFCLRINTNLSF
jgi:hypothetical protein